MSIRTPKIAVATLDAKAYYALTSLLKAMHIPFESVSPGGDVNLNVQLILTTRREKTQMGDRKTLCLEDLIGDNDAVAKEKIFSLLYSGGDDVLVVGVDPGERTGVVAYYREKEILEEVTRSLDETLTTISGLSRNSKAARKIIRIGDGNPKMARTLAENLLKSFKHKVEVEIVDERGTSTTANPPYIKGSRDLRSARIISSRKGRRYQEI
ncbi:MAG: hypothetical protein V3W09_05125 [Nitrososphaerales archaeon]